MAGNAGITDKRARDVLVPPLMAPTSPSVWPGDSGSHRQVTLGEGGEIPNLHSNKGVLKAKIFVPLIFKYLNCVVECCTG